MPSISCLYLPGWLRMAPSTREDLPALWPEPHSQQGSAGASFSSPFCAQSQAGKGQGWTGAPASCCSLQDPDVKSQNNSAPRPSGRKALPGWMWVRRASSGSTAWSWPSLKILLNWPGLPNGPWPPQTARKFWHFRPLVIQTRNGSQRRTKMSWGLIS